MKSNTIIIKALLLLSLVALGVSCTGHYEFINRNPNEVTDEEKQRDGYAVISALTNLQSWVIPTDINDCQYVECLMGGSWSGYFSDTNSKWNSGKISTYNAPNDWTSILFIKTLPNIYNNYNDLVAATSEPIPLSVGKIIKVAAMHRMADAYGSIPYSEIGMDGKLKTKYDTQKEAYESFFNELDDAINTLTPIRDERLNKAADLVYGGDVEQWIKFANSLKLRLAMRISDVEPTIAEAKAIEAITHPVGVMTAVSDNATLKSFGDKGNPLYVAVNYNSDNSKTGGDHHAGADITAYMSAFEDPRCAAYFIESEFAGNPYAGFRSGVTIPGASITSQYAGVKLGPSTPLMWMNVAEVMFLRAEGALNGWDMGGTAQSFYEAGIALSFEQWGVSNADKYIADTDNRPVNYIDPLGTFSYGDNITQMSIAWQEGNDADNYERIIVQKWIANWPLGVESWSERRRTGYPKLMPVVSNASGGVLSNSDIPRRLPYPADEYQTNRRNVLDAVNKAFGGVDNIGAKVWWDNN